MVTAEPVVVCVQHCTPAMTYTCRRAALLWWMSSPLTGLSFGGPQLLNAAWHGCDQSAPTTGITRAGTCIYFYKIPKVSETILQAAQLCSECHLRYGHVNQWMLLRVPLQLQGVCTFLEVYTHDAGQT